MRSPTSNPYDTGTRPDGPAYMAGIFGKFPESGSGVGFARLADAHRTACEQWSRAFGLYARLMDDPTRTPEAKLVASARAMRDALDRARNAHASAVEQAKQEIHERQERMRRALRPADAVQALMDAEMRRYLLSLPALERTELVRKASEAGDVDTIRAVVSHPPFLSGVPEDMHASLRDSYLAVTATTDWTEARALEEGIQKASQAVTELEKHASHYVDFRAAAEIEAKQVQLGEAA